MTSARRALFCLTLCTAACSNETTPDAGNGPVPCPLGDCSAANRECGKYFDPSGACTYCGDCVAPLTCGGGGRGGTCGCNVPDCAALGKNCGELIDTCGGPPVQCGTCTAPESCGGGGADNVCGRIVGLHEACGPSATCTSGLACCSKGGGDRCVTPNRDGSCPGPGPDLIIDRPTALQSVQFVAAYQALACDIEDACLPGPGTYALLRFTTGIANIGSADLVVGDPRTDPDFVYAQCHLHYHYASYVSYRLKDPATGMLVAQSNKPGFCIEDTARFDMTLPLTRVYYCDPSVNGGVQGIQKGWADVYDNSVPCQWVNVTGVPAGTYTLELAVNYDRRSLEEDYDNNTVEIPVTVP